MDKKLIICPACELKGKKEILGEIDNDGNFCILRFHRGLTKVKSNNFQIECGVCGELVYFRMNHGH